MAFENGKGYEVYRVVDDSLVVMTTLDPVKALKKIAELIEKHDVTWCWVEIDTLQ